MGRITRGGAQSRPFEAGSHGVRSVRSSSQPSFSAGRRLVAVRDLLLVVQEHAAQRPPEVFGGSGCVADRLATSIHTWSEVGGG